MRSLLVAAVLGLASVLPSASAQLGYGVFGPLDVNTPTGPGSPSTGNLGALGVQELGGEYHVSAAGQVDQASGNWNASALPHTVYVFDRTGNLRRQYPQDPGASTSAWGYRDGATDGSSLMFGCEAGIFVIDPGTGALVHTIQAANGPQAISSNPIGGQGLNLLSVYRGLAFDPAGNGGNGSFWTANFSSDLLEIDLQGNILTRWPPTSGWSIYGLALDDRPGRPMLWCNSSPSLGALAEIDPRTGIETGQAFEPFSQAGEPPGGLCLVKRPAGYPHAMLVCLQQGPTDEIMGQRLHPFPGMSYLDEPRLIGVARPPGSTLALQAERVQRLENGWEVRLNTDDTNSGGANAGAPGAILMNFAFPGPWNRASTTLVTELEIPWPGSIPPSPIFVQFPHTVGGPDFIIPGGPWRQYFGVGDQVLFELIYLNPAVPAPALPLMSTDVLAFEYRDPIHIVVRCDGGNTYNADPSSGFFSVEYIQHLQPGAEITRIEFDWVNTTNLGNLTMEFDTDQGFMADIFDGGNSSTSGCRGTYRNGSDLACGLDYNPTNTGPSTCDPQALTGWRGSNPTTAPSYQTIEWQFLPGQFTPGKKFEVDIDTDGGLGTNGSSMDGMRVTIQLSNSTVLQGFIAADPSNVNLGTLSF